eukprot:gene10566-12291_t
MVVEQSPVKATVSSNAFDLENYIAAYKGHTKIYRLLFIGEVSKEFEAEAVEMAQKEIRNSPNVEIYGQLCSKWPAVKVDTQWIDQTHKKNASHLDKLEQDLNTAKANMVKDSIRIAHNELGDFYYRIGDFSNALKCYVRTRDYCATSKQILNMCFSIIRVGVDMSNYIHVINYVTKAEQTPDLDQASLAKLRSAVGLANLENGKYNLAAKKFIEAPFDISGNLSDMLSAQDIAIYGGLCALATFDRAELKKKVIDHPVFRNYLELVPEIRELINDFYNSKYSSCLNYLEKLKPTLQLDLHLHDHLDKLYQRIRSKSLVQYFSPFSSIDLNTMATAFNTTVAALEKEISKLIMDDSISARIDSHNKNHKETSLVTPNDLLPDSDIAQTKMRNLPTSMFFSAVRLVGRLAAAKTHFQETFGDEWQSNWVTSKWRQEDGTAGKFVLSAGKWYGDAEDDKGIQTSQDARFYAVSSKFPAFSNEGKDLVLQFTTKHEQKLDCGGAYIKLMPESTDQENFSGDAEYFIMFGPDICGNTKRTHLIFNYKGKNHLIKKDLKVETDQLTHQYTLVLKPDNTYQVQIDNVEIASGSLFEDWDLLPAKEIKDPQQSKPVDWVDVKEIDDPEDVKPADYDTVPATIADPEAVKPVDWNDEDDGEWEPETIANPEYKGAWKSKKIPNPEYKGEWVHPMIANPEYVEDANVYLYNKIGAVGFDLWQVKSGSIFDNIIVTDSIEEAKAFSEAHFEKNQAAEKQMFDDIETKRTEEEKKKMEQAAPAPAAVEESDDESPEVITTDTKTVEVEKNINKKSDIHDEL